MTGEIDFREYTGTFAVKDGITYRETAYWKDSALFDIHDVDKKTELIRVDKKVLQERFTTFADCDDRGIRYRIHRIRKGKGYFSPINGLARVYCRPVRELNEIWLWKNSGEGRIEKVSIYKRAGLDILPSEKKFCVEEMSNRDLMICYDDELLGLTDTQHRLRELYGSRIQFEKPFPCITDVYIQPIQIDQEEFVLSDDLAYGLITISPKSSDGNQVIREICEYFNNIK